MMKPGFYNMDCMEAMKDFPDGFFDLAIVDPPYGDGGVLTDMQTASGSESGLTDTSRINRGGWHGKQKYHLGQTLHVRTPKEKQELREQAEHGRRSTQKNYNVGRCAGKRILYRAFSRLTESDNMGR